MTRLGRVECPFFREREVVELIMIWHWTFIHIIPIPAKQVTTTHVLGKQAQLCLQEELQYHIAGQGFPYRYTEGNVVHRQKKLSKRRRRPQFQKTQGWPEFTDLVTVLFSKN